LLDETPEPSERDTPLERQASISLRDYPEPPSGTQNKIRVIVRVRPFLPDEQDTAASCLRVKDQQNEIE
jgi:hypothetical protein